MSSPTYHLHYWGVPGRGEQVRLALHVAGLTWEDHAVDGAEYFPRKASCCDTIPLLNLPYLEFDGNVLSESVALMRYVGAIGNLTPSDALECARMDQAIVLANQFFDVIGFTFGLKGEEREQAGRDLTAEGGKLFEWVAKVGRFVALRESEFLCGSELTVGDISLFCHLCNVVAGILPGFPAPDYFDSNEQLAKAGAFRRLVGTHPKVASRYADKTEGPYATGFRL
jgi:glutathione S-transferase